MTRASYGPGSSGVEGEGARFQALSSKLVERLFVLVRLAQVHHMENRAVAPALERFMEALRAFHQEVEAEFVLQMPDDGVYVNRRLLRADAATWQRARALRRYFAQFEIGEVSFSDEVRLATVRDFMQAVREGLLDPARLSALRAGRFPGIAFRELRAAAAAKGQGLTQLPTRVQVLRAYGLLVATVEELLERLQRGRRASLVPVRRAAQELVRLPGETESLQMGLLSLPHMRDTLSGRLAFVGVLVLLLARRLGRPAHELRDLCVAGALAGVGRAVGDEYVFAPPDRVAAAGGFLEGAGWLLPVSGTGRPAAMRLVAMLEQRRPQGRRGGHVLSRLVAVADVYERMTARQPHGEGLTSEQALGALRGAADLDPDVVRLLVETLGFFPVGSLVRLSDGSTAVVVAPNPSDPALPSVALLADASGAPVPRRTLDLAGSELHVMGTVDPVAANVNVGQFLFA